MFCLFYSNSLTMVASGWYRAGTQLVAATSGFEWSPGCAPSGNAPCVVPLHRHGNQNYQQFACIFCCRRFIVAHYHSSRYGSSLGGPLSNTSKIYVRQVRLARHVRNHTKSTNHLTNTIIMAVKPLTHPVVWIWWTHATWRQVGGLVHVRSKAAIEAIQ